MPELSRDAVLAAPDLGGVPETAEEIRGVYRRPGCAVTDHGRTLSRARRGKQEVGSLSVERHDKRGKAAFAPGGRIDLQSVPLVGALLARHSDADVRVIEMDAGAASCGDRPGLPVSLHAHRRPAAAGRHLCRHRRQPSPAQLFALTGAGGIETGGIENSIEPSHRLPVEVPAAAPCAYGAPG